MRKNRAVLIAGVGFLLAVMPVLAHHPLSAQYDLNQLITLKGTVTKVAWSNPHARLYINVKDEGSSTVANWELEMTSPNVLMLNGWKIDTLRQGDHVIVEAHPSRHGSNLGYANKVTITFR